MPSMYVAADLRSGTVVLPSPPPAVLWLRFRGDPSPVPAWLLTPGTLERFRQAALKAEAEHLAGNLGEDGYRQLVERWLRIDAWAEESLERLRPAGPGLAVQPSQALPRPCPRQQAWCPWPDGQHVLHPESGRWTWTEGTDGTPGTD